jgi:histone H3/H4
MSAKQPTATKAEKAAAKAAAAANPKSKEPAKGFTRKSIKMLTKAAKIGLKEQDGSKTKVGASIYENLNTHLRDIILVPLLSTAVSVATTKKTITISEDHIRTAAKTHGIQLF